MKKLENLGRKLSKNEQRQIFGGYIKVICTCNSCNMETVVCAANSLGGTLNCLTTASNYCSGIGCTSGTSCNVGGPYEP